jgi:hypothetical protein
MKRYWYGALAVMLMLVVLALAGYRSRSVPQSPAPGEEAVRSRTGGVAGAPAPMPAPSPAAMPPTLSMQAADAAGSSVQSPMKSDTSGQQGNFPLGANVNNPDRKIVLNAEIHLKVGDVENAIGELRILASMSGGYVANSQMSGQKHTRRTGLIVLRVPSGHYESIIARMKDLGEIQDIRDWTQDVTAEFLDLEPRIASKQKHLDQLMKLYDRGGTTEELMRLTMEIDRVQGELESLKGRLKFLTNLVDFSTITVRVVEEAVPQKEPPKSVIDRAIRAFENSVTGLINFLGDVVVWGAGALPKFAFWSALALVGAFAFRLWRTRRGTPPPSTPPPSTPPPSA